MNANVAALYVDSLGPYPGLVEDWYNEQRDARTYNGPHPVVAHPPCGPWGKLRHFCHLQDPALAVIAVDQVQKWGGVLEHPAYSKLWDFCGLPYPGEFSFTSKGWTMKIEQWWWGHQFIKKTWLYIVGRNTVPILPIRPAIRPDGSGKQWSIPPKMRHGKLVYYASALERRLTPLALAKWLIDLAGGCNHGQVQGSSNRNQVLQRRNRLRNLDCRPRK